MALVLSGVSSAHAANFYVSSRDGDDSGSGRSPSIEGANRPWRSLARASQQSFRNGDGLFLKCGETHHGRLELRVGPGEGLLKVAAFGECPATDLPLLDASTAVELVERATKRRAKLDFEPGVLIQNGRAVRRAFARFRVTGNGLQPALPRDAALGQAQAYFRTKDWFIERLKLDGRPGGPLGLGVPNTEHPIVAGTAIAITGKEWVLGNAGWIYDSESRELVVAGSPGVTRVSERAPQVVVNGPGSVLIEGLRLQFAGASAIEIAVSGSATLRNCVIEGPAKHGVEVRSAETFFAMDNQIAGAGEDAIRVGRVGRVVVQRNSIRDTATFEPMLPAVGAINVISAVNVTVSQNLIERSGYIGIRFGEGAQILSNLVIDSCQTMSDCAAIYTWQSAPQANRRPAKISGNVIVGVLGNDDVKLGFRVYAAGIYLDDFTSAVTVEDNVVFGARQGIYLHNAFENRLVNNFTFGDREESLSVYIDSNAQALVSRANLRNVLLKAAFSPSTTGKAVSVVRRLALEPFSEFSVIQFGGAVGRPAVAWTDNIGTFEMPRFRTEPTVPASSPIVASGIELRAANSMPSVTTWAVEQGPRGFRISAPAKTFRIQKGDTNPEAGCRLFGTLAMSALEFRAERSNIMDCAP